MLETARVVDNNTAPEPGCLGLNPGSATYQLHDLEHIT